MTRSLNTASKAPLDITPGPRATFRERHRRQRYDEFLATALDIVAAEGLASLTMQRVTEELECATGSIYGYFPNKGALIGALQEEALLSLSRSLLQSQANLEPLLEDRDPGFTALARIYAAGKFWIAAEDVFPQQIELCRLLFLTPGEVIGDEEAPAAQAPAASMLELGAALLETAADLGALRPGDTFGRSIVILAGTGGVQLAAGLSRWDQRIDDCRAFADTMLRDLFTAWGADPAALDEIGSIIDQLSRDGRFVPVVRLTEA